MTKTAMLTLLAATIISQRFALAEADENTYQVDRYTTVLMEPSIEQLSPLDVPIEVSIPKSQTTVADAINLLLVRSGYQISPSPSAATKILYSLPLPQVHRKVGPMRLRDVLSMLGGEAYVLVVDPVHRLISYDFKEDYKDHFEPLSTESDGELTQ